MRFLFFVMGTQDENPWVRHDSRLCKCNAEKPLRVEGDPTCNVGDVQSLWPHQKSKPQMRFFLLWDHRTRTRVMANRVKISVIDSENPQESGKVYFLEQDFV